MPLPVKSDSVTEHLLLRSFEFRLSPLNHTLTCFLQTVVSIIVLLSNCNFSDHFTQGSSIPWVLLRLKQDKHLQEVPYLIFPFFQCVLFIFTFLLFSFEFPTAFLPNFFFYDNPSFHYVSYKERTFKILLKARLPRM